MRRLHELVRGIRGSVENRAKVDALMQSIAAATSSTTDLARILRTLAADVAVARERTNEQVALATAEASERAAIAAIPQARLLSELLILEAAAARRLSVRRLTVGHPVDRPLGKWIGRTACVSEDPTVQALWRRLLALEAACGDILRGRPNSVLDVPGGVVSRATSGGLHIRLRDSAEAGVDEITKTITAHHSTLAVPRFTYDFPRGKLDNFGHWLVDCLPHVLAVTSIARDARVLLPTPVKRFQRALLSLIGVTDQQVIDWDGSSIEFDRLLVLESDGRTGGGRPLSFLAELRRLLAPSVSAIGGGPRRIYVSRRDAGRKGSWISNEPDVEAFFRSRGFDVVIMTECPLDEQARLFSQAAVVAGVSGAGLTDILFAAPGIDVIVLLSDSLIRWYAKPGRARAKWSIAEGRQETNVAALGDSPRFYTHLAAVCEQRCHSFLSADRVPIDVLAAFVDDVLSQAAPL